MTIQPTLPAHPQPLVIATVLVLLTAVAATGQDAVAGAGESPHPDNTATVVPAGGDDEKGCTVADCRPDLPATLFIGSVIDNFAASELQEYLNPDASGEVDTFERLIGGIDFGYRLHGDPANPDENQLWVYGKTVHGVRSTDVNCQAQPRLSICQAQLMQPDVSDFTDQFRFVLRNASSLEAAVGVRWEFLALRAGDGGETAGSRTAARLYLAAQAGFLAVTDDDDDALDDHVLALGAMATNGKFKGSYLQVGYGPSDLFDVGSDRWKIDAMLSRPLTKEGEISFFARFAANVDAGSGADSIQSYFGFGLDLTRASTLFKKKENE